MHSRASIPAAPHAGEPPSDDASDGVAIDRDALVAQLQLERERLRLAKEAAGLGIHDYDIDANRISWDETTRGWWGVSDDELITYEIWAAGVHPDDLPRVAEDVRAALSPDGPGRYLSEYRVTSRRDGVERWIQATGNVHFQEGRPVRLVGTVQDITPQRQAEERQRASEQRLKIVTESALVLLANVGVDLRFRYVNRRYSERFGLTPEELVGRPVAEVIGAHAFETVKPYIDRVLAGEAFEYEVDVPYEFGVRTMHCFYNPERDGSGGIVGWVSVIADVTEQRRSEAALRASEARFKAFMAISPVAAWIVDRDGRVTYASPAYAKLFPVGDPTGKHAHDLYPREFADEYLANNARVLAADEPLELIESGLRRDGSVGRFLVYKFPLRTADGETHAAGLAVDITDRERTEQALRARELQLRICLQTAQMGTWEFDPRTGAVTTLGSTDEMFGLPPGIEGRTIEDYLPSVHPEDRERLRVATYEAARSASDLSIEYRLLRPDGSVRWIASRGDLIREDDGEIVRMVGALTDITERKETEEELRRLNAELRAADRRKDEFLATLAHELRNPLAPIRNALHLLQLGGAQGEHADEALAVMERQLTQLVRLVDDLLDVGRISQGKVQLRKERLEMAAVVHAALESAGPMIREFGHEVTLRLPAESLVVEGDPVRLSQVLANLLTNAAKYTDRGGRITVTLSRQDDWCVTSVCDSGIGIAAEHLPRLFEMFSQVAPALERSQGGLGIGLSLVKALVEMHGGRVEARSDGLGCGSEFLVHLPLVAGPR